MDDPRAQRTLVKSPPELWAEVSDTGVLAGHLGAFGEIRITRLEPETTVAWEGDRARGTVELEPTGWGTKVTLTARIAAGPPRDQDPALAPGPETTGAQEPPGTDADPEPGQEEPVAPEPAAAEPASAPAATAHEEPEVEPARRRGFFARLFGRRRDPRVEPVAARVDPVPESAPARAHDPAPQAVLEPAPTPEPAREPEVVTDDAPDTRTPVPLDAGRAEAILAGVLDDLGSARHRPFSRG
jgi:hypothetical protein